MEKQEPQKLSFAEKFPQKAQRIKNIINKYYVFSANVFIRDDSHDILRTFITQFFHAAANRPDDVIISGTKLSTFPARQVHNFIQTIKTTEARDIIENFEQWFNTNLHNDKKPKKRQQIEKGASEHIFFWLGGLPDRLQQDDTVWERAERDFQQLEDGGQFTEGVHEPHPVSMRLATAIRFAIIEEFLTDQFHAALFGPTN